MVKHLSTAEIQAILDTPSTETRTGIRDRAMLHLCYAAGLRVSELVGLLLSNLALQPSPTIRFNGKGRKERSIPLWKETAADVRAWLAVRGDAPVPELLVDLRGEAMTRAGFEYVLEKHVKAAAQKCPSLSGKQVSPHQLRHSCAMLLLQATGDIRKVALWLGHENIQTTMAYLRADPAEKLEAIEKALPSSLRRGTFKVVDSLIAALRSK